MSLHVLANHMAAHGRGPDSMLVHMSPQEVQSLQELAVKNGGSLTINPQTGLPEAGFLDSILPIVAGIALGPAGFGLMSAGMAGAAVGGITALATGSLEKGLMAGMGAYGGAGLGEGLAASGAQALSAQQTAAEQVANLGATHGAYIPGAEISRAGLNATGTNLLSEGLSNLSTSGGRDAALNAMGGGMGALKYGAAAVAPMMADQMVQTTTKAPATDTGYIRQKIYDPISGTYTDVGPVKASDWGSRSFSDLRRGYADGGIVALNNGGVAHFRAAGYVDDEELQDQGFAAAPQEPPPQPPPQQQTLPPPPPPPPQQQPPTGGGIQTLAATPPPTTASQPPATTGGLDALAQNQAAITAVTPGANNTATGTTGDSGALTAMANQGAQSVTGGAASTVDAATARAQVANMYRNVLGRDPDQAGLEYWTSQITSGKSPESVYQDMLTSAQSYIPSGVVSNNQIKNLSFADATKDYTGYRSADTGNIVDEWVRNIIGREPTAADKEQPWYKNAATNMSTPQGAAETYKQFQDYAASQANTAADARAAEAAATIKAAGLTDDDVFAKTGMHIVDLVKVNPDFAQNLIGASQLKEAEKYTPKSIEDYVKMDKIVGKDFYGLGQLNQDQQAQLAIAEAKKGIAAGMSDADIAKAIDLKYLKGYTAADVKKFIDDNGLRIINKPANSTVIGGSGTDTITNKDTTNKGVITETGKVLPVVTLSDGTQLVVNPTQVATTAVDKPTVLNEAARTALPVGVSGNQTATINPNGTVSMNTGTPNMPAGGYTGMQSLRDAYTKGGGSLGYAPVAPKTMEEFNQRFNKLTGGSKQAYDYLMGGDYSPVPYTRTGEVMKPYAESVLGMQGDISKKRYLFDPATRSYKANPDYVPITYDSKGNKLVGISNKDVAAYVNANKDASTSDYQRWMADNHVSLEQIAVALGISLADARKRFGTGTTTDTTTTDTTTTGRTSGRANGGLAAMAGGGMSGQYNLGSYSDGGRLLRGPGDGVSDSIPATIGKGRPARLADGEFVVPARIVSEIGNGSTEAGARKLYAMMDRVQAARRNSIGKGNVAKNTRADKYLPA